MKNIIATISTIVILCYGLCSAGSDKIPSKTDLDSAMWFLVHQDYSASHALLRQYLQKYPNSDEALYLTFINEQTRILDYESYMVESATFFELADSLKKKMEKRVTNLHGKDSIDCLFYIANIYGGIGIMQSKTGNWFDAVKNALTSVNLLKNVKALKLDYYAAYLGIGVFSYYTSNSLKWLPFIPDKRQEGVAMLEKALGAKFPYNYAAKNSLCWILIEQQKYKRADSLALSVLNNIPDNTIFIRIRTFIALWTQNYKNAKDLANRLITLSSSHSPVNWTDVTTGYYILAKINYENKQYREVLRVSEELLNKEIPQEYLLYPNVSKNLKYITDIRSKCLMLTLRM